MTAELPTAIDDERAATLMAVLARAIDDLPVAGLRVTDPAQVSLSVLEHLIDEARIRNWISPGMDEGAVRGLVASASEIHRYRGTPWAIRKVLAAFGHTDIAILEGLDAELYDGATQYDGLYFHGQAAAHWAQYRVFLGKPVTIEQATQIRRLLTQVVPARCYLAGLHYREAQHLYNAEIFHNNSYTYGVA